MRFTILLAILGLWWQNSEGYKILCMTPLPTRSHGHLAKGIVDPLLKAGHQVTWVSPFSDWKMSPNLTLIALPEALDLVKDMDVAAMSNEGIAKIKEFARNISHLTITNQRVRAMLVQEQFDAVVTEWFLTPESAGYAAIQQVPWVVLSGIVMHFDLEHLVDEIRSVSTIPFPMIDAAVPMGFWDRVRNAAFCGYIFTTMMWERSANAANYEAIFAPLAEARGVHLPPLHEAVSNISILLVNSHPSISPAMPLPPNVIDIGGYHIEDESAPLPKELQALLDGSPQGVVYFSMGSVVKTSTIPASTVNEFARMFGELPQTVLWKFDGTVANLPGNVHIRPWFPQDSVLAHPNTVVFITHGGQLSLLEAVKRGVPLLTLPVFGDQFSNAKRATRLGMARDLPWSPQSVPQIKDMLKHMLSDRRYYDRAQELSRLFNARPLSPRDLIVHYVELAIQTKGAHHLRSASLQYPWWARWMLDQLLVLVTFLTVTILTIKMIVKRLIASFTKTNPQAAPQGKGKKMKRS